MKVKVLVTQSCQTLCADPMNCSLPGFSIHGILQARILEWVTISFPDPGIKPGSPGLEADALTSEPPRKPPTLRIFQNVHWPVFS